MAVFSRGILCSLAVCLLLVESAMAEVPHSLLIGKVDKLQSRLLDGQGIKPWGMGEMSALSMSWPFNVGH